MVDKKISLLVLSLLFLGIVVSTSCGCIETDSSSKQIGTTVLGFSIVEHEYMFGLMEPEYDARIWVMGENVVNVQGIKESELNWYLEQFMEEDTQSTTTSNPEYYQPTSTPVQIITSDSIQTGKSVAVTCEESGKHIIVTYMGGPDHDILTGLKIQQYCTGACCSVNHDYPQVGDKFPCYKNDGQNRIVVTASFLDGSDQIILDKCL